MEQIIETMRKAALEGSKAMKEKSSGLMLLHKEYKEIVTNCDIASENAIISVLRGEYPDSSVYSEEIGSITGKEGLLWILDPIDGTHNFVHHLSNYAISIGAYRKGKPFAGLVYLPAFDEFFWAILGGGAYLNGRKITVSNISRLKESMIAYDNEFHKHKAMMKNFQSLADNSFSVRIFGSAAMDICSVARGNIEARIFNKTKIFDYAAGIVIAGEAGGLVTDFKGDGIKINTSDLIVSNGKIHSELIGLISQN